MKCKVCGYEINEGRTYCPMCGTKVTDTIRVSSEPEKIDWNTKDFPKPKKLQDIEMNWGNMNSFMKPDGSEGFASVSQEKKQPAPVYEQPKYNQPKAPEYEQPRYSQPKAPVYEQPAYQQPKTPVYDQPKTSYESAKYEAPSYDTQKYETPRYSAPKAPGNFRMHEPEPFGKWQMPPEKKEPPLWYEQNFTATGVMKTGPAFPTKEALQSVMPDATIQYMKVEPPKPIYEAPKAPEYDMPKAPSYDMPKYEPPKYEAPKPSYEPPKYEAPKPTYEAPKYEAPKPSYEPPKYEAPKPSYEAPKYEQPKYRQPAYDTLKNSYTPDFESVSESAEKSPERFNTFVQKNEDFQKLLDKEYDRIRAMRGTDSDVVPSERLKDTISIEKPLKAQDLSAFERSLFGQKTAPVSGSIDELLNTLPEADAVPVQNAPAKTPVQETESPKTESVAAPQQGNVSDAPVFKDSPFTELKLEELISDPLDPRFDINTLEMTIRELKLAEVKDDAQRSARRQKLAAMEAARDAYFRSLDESMAIVNANSQKNRRRDATPINLAAIEFMNSDKNSGANKACEQPEPKPIKLQPQTEAAPIAEEAPMPEEAPVLDELITQPLDDNQIVATKPLDDDLKQAVLIAEKDSDSSEIVYENQEKQLHPDLQGLYDNEEEEDEEKSHGFLRFIGALILIIAVLKLGIIALNKFCEAASITQTANQIEAAVIDAVKNFIDLVKNIFK